MEFLHMSSTASRSLHRVCIKYHGEGRLNLIMKTRVVWDSRNSPCGGHLWPTQFLQEMLQVWLLGDVNLLFWLSLDSQVYHGKMDPQGPFPGQPNWLLLSRIWNMNSVDKGQITLRHMGPKEF